MRAKSMILLLIAGVCGLVASIGISQVLENKGDGTQAPTDQLYVAVADVDIGAKLDSTNVKLDTWPKDRIPEGAITKLEDIKDKFPRMRLYKGEPILVAKLMDTSAGGDTAASVPEGYRVVSVKVTIDEVVSGLVKPGDRVDVIAFFKQQAEIVKTQSQTILKDVRVFAVNSETERATGTDGEQIVAKTVSLLVKPSQVESVMMAGELGKIRLSLRRPNDTSENEDDDGTDIEELLGDTQGREEKSKAKPANLTPSVKTEVAAAPVAVPVFVEQQQPPFRMTILGPAGTQQFQWRDPTQLPTPVTADGEPAPTPTTLPLAPVPAQVPDAVEPPNPDDTPDDVTIKDAG